ncbi:HEPN domain-containing protein [Thermoflexus hugenholtzii]
MRQGRPAGRPHRARIFGTRAPGTDPPAPGSVPHPEKAEHALEDGDYDWACFAAHQAAEKAVQTLFLAMRGEGWGRSLTRLLHDLKQQVRVPEDLLRAAQRLDKRYIPTRYPNGFDTGAPVDYYTFGEAQQALEDARRIYVFCEQQVRAAGGGSGGAAPLR